MCKKLLRFLVFVFLLSTGSIMAQSKTVTGTVSDENGQPIPGASVVLKGTTVGVSTDFDGNYSLDLPNDGTLIFSSIGFAPQEVATSGRTVINVSLQEDFESLDEVVVTALGIKREAKALGYSVSEVEGEELTTVRLPNAINALQGKVAGVNITSNATGAGGSSRVVIRGANSLTGNNQPLYVVDGIPIGNENNGAAGTWGGNDGGDGISSINPDNIESVSVLKGGTGSALYGSRGGNGVILITTKGGSAQEGIGVEYSGSVLFDEVDTSIFDFQRQYGQGRFGRKPVNAAEALNFPFSSWGERLDGSQVPQWDGAERAYSDVGNNMENFYRTGTTYTNTVALIGGSEDINFRFSAADFTNRDIVPNSGLNRKTFALNMNAVLAEKLSLQTSVQYIVEDTKNRPRLSDSPGNANYAPALLPANVDVRTMDPWINADGTEVAINGNNPWNTNPYWAAYEFRNEDKRNRIIGSTNLRYDIFDWLYVNGRVGIDHYTRKRTSVEPYGTAFNILGSMSEQEIRYTQLDADFILGSEVDLTEDIGLNAFVGANSNQIKTEELNLGGSQFIVPGLEDIANLTNQNRDRRFSERKIGSLYGSVELSYRDWLFLNATGRNDWFSTLSLPGKETPNNDFYPAISTSLVLSEVLDLPDFVTFLKLRGGFAQTAGGADEAYKLALTYEIFGQGHLGNPLGRVTGNSVPNVGLVPWEKDEVEIGFDARFFDNRLSVDFAYYANNVTNDIVGVTISQASGFDQAQANIGRLENKGFELLLSGTPIRTSDFSWQPSLNLTFNEGTVVETNPENGEIALEEPRTRNVRIVHIPGERYGLIKGVSYTRDDQGRIVYDIDEDGVPLARQGDRQVFGEGVHPWTWGFSNTFRYKEFSLYFLIDGKIGGQVFSGTNALAYGNGLHHDTLEGRENGLTVSGVDGDGNEFTTTVSPENLQTYYGRISSIAEEFVYDADFVKLRQLSLGYTVPSSLLDKTFLNSLSFNLTAQNLFYISRAVDNISPEAAYNTSNSQGLEYFGVPSTRTYGLSINAKF